MERYRLEQYKINDRLIGLDECLDDDGKVDFYDIFDDSTGECINQGNPFFSKPSKQNITKYLNNKGE
jgi:hypothetical protein|tara:strand:+ start:210 stop:410 length:201 start_codon:yes stop_codon:yes gene_type:complete